MALTPGQTSGTTNFIMTDASVVQEAYDRCGMMPPELTRHHFISARTSLNLVFSDWSNSGVNLWKIVQGSITLIAGVQVYNLPDNLVTITEMWYETTSGGTTGFPIDRILTPITRQQWAMISNKTQQGLPTQYWYERAIDQQVTFWQNPAIGAPNATINWFGLQVIEDSTLANGNAPDVVNRGLDALCASLAVRLATKFKPERKADLKADEREAWDKFVTSDQEPGPIMIAPNVGVYGRIGSR